MTRIALILAVAVAQLIAFTAFAQTPPAAEFGRSHGGEIEAITKQSRPFSGALGLTRSAGSRGNGYDAYLGGSLLQDRLWFFGSASIMPSMQLGPAFNANNNIKLTAQPVDWTDVTATYSDTGNSPSMSLPSSFLSLRSTTMLSPNSIFTFSVSQTKTRPATGSVLAPGVD